MWNIQDMATSKWINFWKMDKPTAKELEQYLMKIHSDSLFAHQAPTRNIERKPTIFVYFSDNSGELCDHSKKLKGKFRFLRWNIRLKGLHHKDYWPNRNDKLYKDLFFKTIATHRAEIHLSHEAAIACILKQI
jgi:hypothetical protein